MPKRQSLAVLHSSQSVEWYTPPDLLAEIDTFLGGIDLDPARPDLADGLGLVWYGRVFLNPPYGRHIGRWTERFCTDPLSEGILLVPARTDTRWFQPLWVQTICFVRGRLRFSSQAAAPFPSVLVYRGARCAAFAEAFAHWGHIVQPARVAEAKVGQLPLLAGKP